MKPRRKGIWVAICVRFLIDFWSIFKIKLGGQAKQKWRTLPGLEISVQKTARTTSSPLDTPPNPPFPVDDTKTNPGSLGRIAKAPS